MGKRERLQLVVVSAVVFIVLASVAGHRWLRKDPPYGPEVLSPDADISVVTDNASLDPVMKQYGAPSDIAIQANPGDQLVVGRVTWSPPPKPLDGGWYGILLIDKDSGLKPPVMSASGPNPERIRIGSDPVFNVAAERYSWLKGAGDVRASNGSYLSASEAIIVNEEDGPITFVALFPAVGSPDDRASARASPAVYARAPVTLNELLVAMVYVGPDRQIYWAERLFG